MRAVSRDLPRLALGIITYFLPDLQRIALSILTYISARPTMNCVEQPSSPDLGRSEASPFQHPPPIQHPLPIQHPPPIQGVAPKARRQGAPNVLRSQKRRLCATAPRMSLDNETVCVLLTKSCGLTISEFQLRGSARGDHHLVSRARPTWTQIASTWLRI